MASDESEEPFCGTNLIELGYYYNSNISGYADVSICLIGSLLNTFNLVVFTRKSMISPANLIFTHLAFADLTVLLVDIVFVWNEILEKKYFPVDKQGSFQWLMVHMCCNFFMVTMHTASVWLTVMLTIWRYIAVVHPMKEEKLCNMKTTRNVIIVGYVACILLSIPMYFSRKIEISTFHPMSIYVIRFKTDLWYSAIFFLYGVLFKILPSIILTAFSFRLIVTLISTKKETECLTSSSNCSNRIKQQIDRSTKILLMVLMLFITAEVPLGTLGLVNAIHGEGVHHKCYISLGGILDTITILNTSATFLVYYIMSRQFRNTFKSLFRLNQVYFQKFSLVRMISRNMNTDTSEI